MRITVLASRLENALDDEESSERGAAGGVARVAMTLARLGHHTTLYLTARLDTQPPHMIADVRGAGVHVRPIEGFSNVWHTGERKAYRVYETLRANDADLYLFNDCGAEGFYCFTARETGVAFDGAQFGVLLTEPTQWRIEADGRFVSSPDELYLIERERGCAERADFVVSPTQFLLDWLDAKGWEIPNRHYVIPYPRFEADSELTDPTRHSQVMPTLTYVGEADDSSAVSTFVNALKSLPDGDAAGIRVSFLNRSDGDEAPNSDWSDAAASLAGSGIATQIIPVSNSRARVNYLRDETTFAISAAETTHWPRYADEALAANCPLLTSDRGGACEQFRRHGRRLLTFRAHKKFLATQITELLSSDGVLQRPDSSCVVDAWRDVIGGATDRLSDPTLTTTGDESTPLVTVVISLFNRCDLVNHAIESFAAQTYQNLEIVVVDDGSTDPATMRYLADLPERGDINREIRVVRQENRYVGAARNHGVKEAKGEYVVIFDDDNYACPDLVATLVRAAHLTGAACVSAGEQFFHAQSGAPRGMASVDGMCMYWGDASRLSSLFQNRLGDACGLYKKSWIERVGGFHEEYGVTFEDWQLYLKIQMAGGRVVSVPEPLFYYRVTEGSMFRTTDEHRNYRQLISIFAESLPRFWELCPDLILGMHDRCRRVEEISSSHESGHDTGTQPSVERLKGRVASSKLLGPVAKRVKNTLIGRVALMLIRTRME